MEEQINVSTTINAEEPEISDASEAWDSDDWDGEGKTEDTASVSGGGENQPAAKPEVKEGVGAPKAAEHVDETKEQNQLLELKYMDEVKSVTRDEAVVLAQKGLDYDRIRTDRETFKGELEKIKPDYERLSELEGWVKKIAGGKSVEEFMDYTDAHLLSEKNGVDENIALQMVKFQREKAAFDAKKTTAEAPAKAQAERGEAERRKAEDVREFAERFPDVAAKLKTEPELIPQTVWDRVKAGEKLTAVYAEHAALKRAEKAEADFAELQKQLEIEKQNEKNAGRATGSLSTDGEKPPSDAWGDGWDD